MQDPPTLFVFFLKRPPKRWTDHAETLHSLRGIGESGARPCTGQIRSPQFLGKLLAVHAPENAGVFLVWQTIVQRIKLQNVCNDIGENCRCVFCE